MTELTVVIVPLESSEKLRRCLNALALQRKKDSVEIIVPHDESLRSVEALRAEFSNVSFLAFPNYQTFASLRSHGVRSATGKIIAITEDHCIPREDWTESIVGAHMEKHAAIGGAVEKKRPDSKVNWALYLIDYLRYSSPTEGPSRELTDCNVSYKRKALADISEIWKEEFHEPEVNGALDARGMSLWLTPGIVLEQQRTIGFFEAIRDRYRFGRLFGARRAISASSTRRLLYLALGPLLPAALTVRILRDAHLKPGYAGPFWRCLWIIIFLNTAWSWGEFVGSLTRTADSSLSCPPPSNASNL